MKKKLLQFPFPLVVAIIYIFIGVLSHKWHPYWLIFLLIPAYYEIVSRMSDFSDNEEKSIYESLKKVPITSIVILVYLIIGFTIHLWHPTWLLFLLIPLYYAIIPLFKSDKKKTDSTPQYGEQYAPRNEGYAPNPSNNANAGYTSVDGSVYGNNMNGENGGTN